MNARKAKQYKNLLHKKMTEIQNTVKINRLDSDEAENFPDPCDLAAFETGYVARILSLERHRSTILELRKAIRRIDEGAFGICRICGNIIPGKRLRANPTADLCIECRKKAEQGRPLSKEEHAEYE